MSHRNLLSLVVLSLCIVLVGCDDRREFLERAAAMEAAEKEQAAMEVIEAEAHRVPRQWIRVEISKYDGRCASMNMSPRGELDAIGLSDAALWDAQKVGEHDYELAYARRYDTVEEKKRQIFVTSLALCEDIIRQNTRQHDRAVLEGAR